MLTEFTTDAKLSKETRRLADAGLESDVPTDLNYCSVTYFQEM